MWRIFSGVFVACALLVLAGPQPAEAGSGQGLARAATGEPAITRVAAAGHARSFDWHRGGAVKAAAATRRERPLRVSVLGRGGWICSPAGVGTDSRCRSR
jgi:hypothetical protein